MGPADTDAIGREPVGSPASMAGALAPWRVAVWVAANVEEIICAILLVVMVGSVSSAVFCRYVLNAPLSWPEELSRFALVWMTFVGSALAAKRNSHILVDFFVSFLPERGKIAMSLLVNTVLLAFLALFFWLSLQIVQKSWVSVSPALSINMGLVYLSMPLSSALMFAHLARQTVDLARQLARPRGA
jgi:TRAP-type transport system small permease protein